jgi:competence protein ComEC
VKAENGLQLSCDIGIKLKALYQVVFMKFDVFLAFEEFLAAQRENLLVWISIWLGIGSAIYFGLNNQPSFMTTASAISGCVFLFATMMRLYQKKQDSKYPLFLLMISGCLLSLAVGFTAAHIKTDIVHTPMVERETRPVMIEGIINHREDQEGKKGTLLFLSDLKIENWEVDKTPEKIRITVKQKTDVRAGDKIKFLAKLTPLSPPVAPNAYDFARHYYFESIGALGYALSQPQITERGNSGLSNLENIRTSISNHIKSVIPEREAGIVSALMTGERAAIADEDWDALRASGLAHIISISGMHVVMMAVPVFFLVRLLLAMIPYVALRWPIKKIAAGMALLVCCLYVGLVVPTVPTTRALLMTGIGLIAIMLDRSPFSLRLVAFSAILVLIVAPESMWSVSFQMSFAAVTALVAMAEMMRPMVTRLYSDASWFKRGLLFLGGTLLTSTIASLSTAPFSLYHFQQVASYSVLANTLAVPISGLLIMPMVIVSFALMPFGLADWSLKIMGVGVDWLLDIARWTQDLNGSVITTPALPDMFLVMMSSAGLIVILFHGRAKLCAIIPLCVAIISVSGYAQPNILIEDEAKIIAIKDNDKIYISSLRREKFTAETWLKRWNSLDAEMIAFPRQGSINFIEKNGKIICDPAVCRIELNGKKISFGNRAYELKQECAWADLIVSEARLPRNFCGDKMVKILSYYDFKRSGSISINLENDLDIKTVSEQRGLRPWSTPNSYK